MSARAPGASELRAAFDARATSYALWPELAEGETRHRVLERLEPVADEVLLDLGCGPGAMGRAAGPFVNRVVLCDLSPAMLRVAGLEARRAERARAGAGLVQLPDLRRRSGPLSELPRTAADALALPFRGGAFDLVACRHAARLFGSPERAAAEMHRVLRRGGRVAICDVMATGDAEVDRVVLEIEEGLAPCPVTLRTPEEWAAVLAAAGFRVDWHDQPLVESDAGRSLLECFARTGASQAACDRARELLLGSPEPVRRALGVIAHGGDIVLHPPFGIVGATRVLG